MFVTTSGNQFVLDGQPFFFVGTNNYWLMQQRSYNSTSVDDALNAAQAVGVRVIRTWGFADGFAWTNSTDPAILQESPGVYREKAFASMDYVVSEAGKRGIKLIITLVNNWDDFGGMNQYVKWAGLTGHDLFYTDASVKALFRVYIIDFVNRINTLTGIAYKDDPTIMAWELANEARARSDAGAVLNVIRDWYEEMARHVRMIDGNHLIGTGEEGFDIDGLDYSPYANGYVVDGSEGTSFKVNTAIPEINFGSTHLYPNSWGLTLAEGNLWISDHQTLAINANKPVILGEYGNPDRTVYASWLGMVHDSDMAGSMLWEFNPSSRSRKPDDIIYPDDTALVVNFKAHAESMNAKSFSPTVKTVVFKATAIVGSGNTISKNSGDAQSGQVNNILGAPFEVFVGDPVGRPVSGATVLFSILSAPTGAIGQNLSTSAFVTGSAGVASSTLTFGDKAGVYEVKAILQ